MFKLSSWHEGGFKATQLMFEDYWVLFLSFAISYDPLCLISAHNSKASAPESHSCSAYCFFDSKNTSELQCAIDLHLFQAYITYSFLLGKGNMYIHANSIKLLNIFDAKRRF